LITLRNLTLQRGDKRLLHGVNLTIHAGQKLGLVGPNGCGKSSVLALLAGELSPEAGDVDMPAALRISRVLQEAASIERSAGDYVLDGDAELRQAELDMGQAEQRGEGVAIAAAHQHFEEIGGWAAPARAATVLDGLGFPPAAMHRPVAEFSGGFRMRLDLARALMRRADLLLLDEPTNHLDLEAVVWLEEWLAQYEGILLVVSHDREFLDAIVNMVAAIDRKNLRLYRGNYSAFEVQHAAQLAQQDAAYRAQQRDIAHLHDFIDRFRAKASKARQAQSRLKALARMEIIAPAHVDSPFTFHFRGFPGSPDPVLVLDRASAGYGSVPVLSGITYSIPAGARIGLLGRNGAGKSTLVRLIAGRLAPGTGKRIEGKGLRVGYFAQHQLEALDPESSPLQHLARLDPAAREQELRTFLGSFGFPGNTALDPTRYFSGGERARLALALIIWQRPNLLLLDEPTNHLDIEMRFALTQAMLEYEGALVLISHDRHLIRTTADTLLLVEGGRVAPFDGDLDDYRTRLRRPREPANAADATLSRRDERRQSAQARQEFSRQMNPVQERIRSVEKDITRWAQEQTQIEALLAAEDTYLPANRERLQLALAGQSRLRAAIDALEAEWLSLHHRLEQSSQPG
jgi:ATP-binding cassette subfamily F protein 3